MSPEEALCAGIGGALAPLGLNAVFDSYPARTREPFAVVEPGLGADWSTKDRRGRELRPVVTLLVAAAEAGPVRGLAADAIEAVEGLAPGLDGWRIASLVAARCRTERERDGRWRARIEFRVRMMEDI